ncbi:MAG: hypothetical protein JNL12_18405 [Planctomycetes bacterium]|nr:hypothetical protein [Planctomycetota bacterium]
MTLLAAWQLLWLVPVVPLLWWWSLPPRPSQVLWTPHLVQVERALAALRRRPPRLSRWRFVLLVCAAVATALAAARPLWHGTDGASRLVVVLDGSASMAARAADGRSAWHVAQQRVREVLAGLPDAVEVTVLRAGGSLLRRHGAAARALHELGAPDGCLAVDLPAVAASLATDDRTAVWTLTDGQGQPALPTHGALTVVPHGGANAAVLAVRLVDGWPLPQLELEVDVVAFAAGEVPAEVRVEGAVVQPAAQSLALAPGERRTVAFALARTPHGGDLEIAVVLAGDRLPDDDRAIVPLAPLPAPRIAVLAAADGLGPTFAKAAAQALAAEVAGTVVEAAAGAEVGLLLVDGGRVPLVPGAARALTFGSELIGAGAVAGSPVVEPWASPGSLGWDRRSALGLGLDLSELRIDRAFPSLLPPGDVFLWSEEAPPDQRGASGPVPLAVVCGDGACASVHFAFRLADSNLPLLAAFPQLLRRAFVRSHGLTEPSRWRAAPPPGEQDLLGAATAEDRPLPKFATGDTDLVGYCLWVGLLALAVRGWLRMTPTGPCFQGPAP